MLVSVLYSYAAEPNHGTVSCIVYAKAGRICSSGSGLFALYSCVAVYRTCPDKRPLNANRYTVTDENVLKRLYGLK